MPFYRKKPVEIEARRFMGDNVEELAEWSGATAGTVGGRPVLWFETLEGVMRVSIGAWVIRGVAGEFYPCQNSIFMQTYEAVE